MMVEETKKTSTETVFTHYNLPLLSGITDQALGGGDDICSDLEKLKFMIKINDAICASKQAEGSNVSGIFNSNLNEKKSLFRPLAIVGPSGAGKVWCHFIKLS